MFRYEINDGEALIIDFTDKSVTHIDIPEFIGGYPVTGIRLLLSTNVMAINIPKSVKYVHESCFINAHNLTYINNIKINNGFNLINDNFIYLIHYTHKIIYKVKFNIIDDYVCIVYETYRYIICGRLCNEIFN